MPRIRTLKPEHKQHRKVGPLTHRQYRLWVGMITEADDDGRLVADPAQLRALVFSYHPSVTLAHVSADMAALADLGLIVVYDVAGVRYAAFPSWRDHQVPSRPTPSKLPAPPAFTEDSRSTHGGISESSRSTPEGTEGNGTEGNKEGNGTPPTPHGGTDADSWLSLLNRETGAAFKATDANLRPIRARIGEGYTVEDAAAVVKAKLRDWRGTDYAKYLRPSTLFGTKFDSYLQAARNGHGLGAVNAGWAGVESGKVQV